MASHGFLSPNQWGKHAFQALLALRPLCNLSSRRDTEVGIEHSRMLSRIDCRCCLRAEKGALEVHHPITLYDPRRAAILTNTRRSMQIRIWGWNKDHCRLFSSCGQWLIPCHPDLRIRIIVRFELGQHDELLSPCCKIDVPRKTWAQTAKSDLLWACSPHGMIVGVTDPEFVTCACCGLGAGAVLNGSNVLDDAHLTNARGKVRVEFGDRWVEWRGPAASWVGGTVWCGVYDSPVGKDTIFFGGERVTRSFH